MAKTKLHTATTRACKYEDFDQDWLKYWTDKLGSTGLIHAKPWEQAILAQALHERGMLQPGKRGIGFGVGNEPLPSLFAATGAKVLATDQYLGKDAGSQAWDDTGQLAKGKQALYFKNLIDKKTFEKNVQFKRVDMNNMPKSLNGKFDFAWSNCVIGHLGSLKKSEEFLLKQFVVLKPGGVAVQTTEMVVSSLKTTISDNSDTVAWRLSDLEGLFKRIEAAGYSAAPLKIELGEAPQDYKVDFPPYGVDIWKRVHIKIIFADLVITQILLIFEKKPSEEPSTSKQQNEANKKEVQRMIKANPDIKQQLKTYRKNRREKYRRHAQQKAVNALGPAKDPLKKLLRRA